jgi:hypothetical protein
MENATGVKVVKLTSPTSDISMTGFQQLIAPLAYGLTYAGTNKP